MLLSITNELIGKKIKLIKMNDEPYPIEPNTFGVIVHIGGDVISVKWENGRHLGVIIDFDEFEIISD